MAHWYLIHGAASSRLTWTRQLAVLPEVSRASLPAFETVAPTALIDAWADYCLSDLTQPSVVMGHSLGGAIALTMALKAPTMILGLVLVGTAPRLPVNPDLLEALRTKPQEALAKIVRWSLGPHADPLLLSRSLAQIASVDGRRAYREFLSCTYFDVVQDLPRITCPRAIIAGERDRMTPLDLVKEFLKAWPDVPFYTVPEAGHMMMLENPDAFNDILRNIAKRFHW
ncbi:MAG: alpha/beta hydrolase [Firmicutes bacterium]|nr:alpha/beta hydrolase [Bacillota bacterium]